MAEKFTQETYERALASINSGNAFQFNGRSAYDQDGLDFIAKIEGFGKKAKTDEEKIAAEREKAKKEADKAVKAAEKALSEAKTDEEKKAAEEQLQVAQKALADLG